MASKHRNEIIRKKQRFEEKTGWESINDHSLDRASHKLRALFAVVVVFLISLFYLNHIYKIQITDHQLYTLKAEDNRIRIRPIEPIRGNIFDRNGNMLAESYDTFDIIAKKEKILSIDEFIINASKVFNLNKNQQEQIHNQIKNKKLKEITLKKDTTLEEFTKLSVDQYLLPEMELIIKSNRRYIYPEAMSHLLGYTGKLSESDFDSVVDVKDGMTRVGKIGIERFYQNLLSGSPGYEKLETNANNEVIRVLEKKSALRGQDIYLTIDSKLQNYSYDLLKDKEGTIIVMNPHNGDILSFISHPGYDNNLFAKGISSKDYKILLNDKSKPLFNRVLFGQYPPGSTIKPFFGIVALEEGVIDKTKVFACTGAYKLKNYKRPFKCWKKDGHMDVNLSSAVASSCDVFFYRLAETSGIDLMHDKLKKFGFGEKTFIDLYGERKGLLPSREWKNQSRQAPWYPGETLNVGIGQGYFLTTPLQLASATSLLASGGDSVTPHLFLKSSINNKEQIYNYIDNKTTIDIDIDSLHIVNEAMWRVIYDDDVGTASHLKKIEGIEFAGKTGTAQVYNLDKGKTGTKSLQDHALFISFAPFESPEIIVSVIVDNGGSGSATAAPIARDIINFYFKNIKTKFAKQ
ncbi:penicillin-binding protein 2 [Gammaproteobacteria bacterium]|nr:penicillin-binding protein 2 [Gammaproteobacteria bacterium]